MGESLPIHHGDHVAGKGDNLLQHCNLVHQFVPVPQAMKGKSRGSRSGNVGSGPGKGS